jgi:hypothetical protein
MQVVERRHPVRPVGKGVDRVRPEFKPQGGFPAGVPAHVRSVVVVDGHEGVIRQPLLDQGEGRGPAIQKQVQPLALPDKAQLVRPSRDQAGLLEHGGQGRLAIHVFICARNHPDGQPVHHRAEAELGIALPAPVVNEHEMTEKSYALVVTDHP